MRCSAVVKDAALLKLHFEQLFEIAGQRVATLVGKIFGVGWIERWFCALPFGLCKTLGFGAPLGFLSRGAALCRIRLGTAFCGVLMGALLRFGAQRLAVAAFFRLHLPLQSFGLEPLSRLLLGLQAFCLFALCCL